MRPETEPAGRTSATESIGPMSTTSSTARADAATAAALALVAAAGFAVRLVQYWPYTVDDAYISARYAQHLARGYGLVYNPGETPVEGSASFLHVLVLAACDFAGLDVIRSA